jgi:18S rRNA (guanine1575-N7)-methyltransferase
MLYEGVFKRYPEAQSTAEECYAVDAYRYTATNGLVQRQLTERALRLARGSSSGGGISACQPSPWAPGSLVLDVGCGSGLSGAALERDGLVWVGADLSPEMLQLAAPGAVCLSDIGQV